MEREVDKAFRDQTALITGASGGIGYQLARIFAWQGFQLVLVSRDTEKLATIAREFTAEFGVSARALPKDLSIPASPQEIFDELQRDGVPVDILINNAGYGVFGPFAATPLDEILGMIQLNMTSLTHLTRLFLPQMIGRRGKIMNVASTAAFQPGPLMAVYYASKAYVLSLSQAIANELRGSGVTVTALCPGPTRTGFQERAHMTATRVATAPWVMDAETVAKIGYDALMAGKPLAIPGFMNALIAWSVRLAPRRFVAEMARKGQE